MLLDMREPIGVILEKIRCLVVDIFRRLLEEGGDVQDDTPLLSLPDPMFLDLIKTVADEALTIRGEKSLVEPIPSLRYL